MLALSPNQRFLMSYILRLIVCCLVLINTNSLLAATEFKLGWARLDAAIQAEHEFQQYLKDVEVQKNLIAADKQKAQADLEMKVNKFKSAMAKLSDSARAAEEAQLSAEVNAFHQKSEEKIRKLEDEYNAKILEFQNKNQLLLDSIGRRNNYSVVIPSVLYVADEFKKNDLTAELISQYNKAYPVKPAAPKAPAKPSVKAPVSKS